MAGKHIPMASRGFAALCIVALVACAAAPLRAEGDRAPQMNIVFPADAFVDKGGRILDITKAPYNAKGDGKTDDTKAFVAAYEFVAQKLRDHGWASNNLASYIIYIPNGTYLVSDTLIFSGERPKFKEESTSGLAHLRIVGQDRQKTIIRLRDNCPGFGAGEHKPVVAYQKGQYKKGHFPDDCGTNVPAENQCRNLTIDTGRGNPGAVGLMFLGANICHLQNIAIRSGDGTGYIGLDLPVYSVQGYLCDLTVEGFEHGIRVGSLAENNPTLEHLTLRGQMKSGIWVEQGSPCVRDLLSQNAVSAVRITNTAAHVVLLDSKLQGGAPGEPALHLAEPASQLFVRNVEVAGYGSSVRVTKNDVLAGYVEEYVSGGVFTLRDGQTKRSLNLPIEDTPATPWESNLSLWANVDAFEGKDDGQKAQKAMASGLPIIYFPRDSYDFKRTVRVPATVRQIHGLYARLNGALEIAEASPEPLLIESLNGYYGIVQKAPRTVILRHLSAQYSNQQKAPTKLFIESGVNMGRSPEFCTANQTIWARNINDEYKDTSNFKVFGGTMWVLGHKTESPTVSFEVKDGGVLEVLGGYRNECVQDAGNPMLVNDGGQVSFIGHVNMSSVYEQAVWEVRDGQTKKLTRTDLPVRKSYYKDEYCVPLYAGYDRKEFPYPVLRETKAAAKPAVLTAVSEEKARADAKLQAALPEWDAKLKARTIKRLAEGQKPRFLMKDLNQDVSLTYLAEDGKLRLANGGLETPFDWSRLTLEDKSALAAALASSVASEDKVLAAFFCLARGRKDAAEKFLTGLSSADLATLEAVKP